MFFQQKDRHEQMAKLDPRDTNGDGVVSPQEAAAYIREYLENASPEERQAVLKEYVGGMSPEQRREMGDAIVRSPANPVQAVRPDDDDDLIDAYTKTAQAPAQNGRSPLEEAFAPGGLLSNPMVKAGLVGLAGMIGSRMLRR
ncbi:MULTISPECIES: hypothetical protein [unclassified Deinococcus]|jgi:hypothetical protein|uniref:hypothetical protein n=1 Tax=unclassified Deinococcus TaxID=2623546 RepID=UPI0006DC2105|nr:MULTISPECIES: hypothetical protein [unclassified Deinococcus]MBX8465111.1 hypothetical protein [Deinococcus sp. RIT780]MCD0159165.1 hypothetical protein [Deinococcus sp. 6GRE01]MCD0163023.1 hypothetical protein [Deinococcus sp. 6YEL10]MCD0167372.1 hypothetical protein [Deinococcus sp. 12RED42]MCD0170835.1 hypothetical protein [Deinococcus sp. 23YEL01]